MCPVSALQNRLRILKKRGNDDNDGSPETDDQPASHLGDTYQDGDSHQHKAERNDKKINVLASSVYVEKPEKQSSPLVFVMGKPVGRQQAITAMWRFNTGFKIWHRATDLTTPLQHFAITFVRGTMVVSGGLTSTDDENVYYVTDQCHLYDAEQDRWREGASLNSARYGHASVALNNIVYVIGGNDEHNDAMNTVEMYRDKQWTNVSPMTAVRHSPAAVAFRNKILVAGGGKRNADENQIMLHRSCEKYDPETNQWSRHPSLPIRLHRGTLVVVHKRMYMVGGYFKRSNTDLDMIYSDSVYKYNSKSKTSNKWEAVGSLDSADHNAVVVVVNGRLQQIGSNEAVNVYINSIDLNKDTSQTDISSDKFKAPLLPVTGITACVLYYRY